MKSLRINEDTIISFDIPFNDDAPYEVNPIIKYKDYIFERILETKIYHTRKGHILRIINCKNKKFEECPFNKKCAKCKNFYTPWQICPYHTETKIELQRKNSKNYKNAEEFMNLMPYFIHFHLCKYAIWIIQNLNIEVTKELFEKMKSIPELDPKYFEECFSYGGRSLTLRESETLIRDQEEFALYTTNDGMPPLVESYLKMTNDYLTNLNDMVSGAALDIVSKEYAKLKARYNKKRILVPLFDFILLAFESYDVPYSYREEYGEKYSMNNNVLSVPKNEFNSFIEDIRSKDQRSFPIYSLILERYERKEHEKPLTEEEIELF